MILLAEMMAQAARRIGVTGGLAASLQLTATQ